MNYLPFWVMGIVFSCGQSSLPPASAPPAISDVSLCELVTQCSKFNGKHVRFRASFVSDGLENSLLTDPKCALGIEPYTSEEVDDHSDLKALDSALAQG